MQRSFRLHQSSDIQRVRRTGKSYAHPLLVLVAARGEPPARRVAFSVGKRVGGAVVRNRARRRLREAIRPLAGSIAEGWDLLLIARAGAAKADFSELAAAVRFLLLKAGLLVNDDDPHARSGG
jgi:ribonuclease P protein component